MRLSNIGSYVLGMCLLAGNLAAEDIEIYSATVGSGSAGTVNPNLLFIADTSGSMNGRVPVPYDLSKGDYDPSFDYGADGAAADDDLIYVYSSLQAYTGVTITQGQNKCQALTNAHTASPTFPLFTGKTLQWHSVTSSVILSPGNVCETTPTVSTDVTLSNREFYSSWQQFSFISSDDIFADSRMTLNLRNVGRSNTSGGLYIFERTAGGIYTGRAQWSCYITVRSRGRTNSCTVREADIPYAHYHVGVYFRATHPSRSAQFQGSTFSYNVGAPPVQVDPTCVASDPTYGTVTDGDWSTTLQTSSDANFVLECEDDNGVHGISGSANPYPAFCGAAECATPRYTASAGLDWGSSGASVNFFYTGNYHDYLNYSPPLPSPLFDSATNWDTYGRLTVEDFCARSDRGLRGPGGISVPTSLPVYVQDSRVGVGVGFINQCDTKRNVMVTALINMGRNLQGVNMGLARFNTWNGFDTRGGVVTFDIRDIDGTMADGVTLVRNSLINRFDALTADASTPLSETLFEAYRYFAGQNLVYGRNNGVAPDEAAFTSSGGSRYESPMTHSCQSNNIILLTDGYPFADGALDETIRSITGTRCGTSSDANGNCLDELAEYMADNDLSSSLDGTNSVNTYTIGFDIAFPLLEDTAEKGNGDYYTATNYSELQDAFQQILIDIELSQPSTLVAPAVSVNAFNELQHRDQIYYATFKPQLSPRWDGNVKKYGITNEGLVYGQAGPTRSVIGDDGFFLADAQSFWSDFPDGSTVEEGGFREQLTNSRNVYVDAGAINGSGASGIVKLGGSDDLRPSALGVTGMARSRELRDWILGIDIDDFDDDSATTDAHRYAADSLHSKPFVITYSGTSESDAFDVLFIASNQGFLRAVDARNNMGTELWSYIPNQLLPNVNEYRENNAGTGHTYGLDGEATIWATEAAGSSASNFDLGTVYMYQGMRRGGRSYYAWDISNADGQDSGATPISELWSNGPIVGGVTSGFGDLGQTWSKTVRTKIRFGCTNAISNAGCSGTDKTRDVLVFSGGYDPYYDTSANNMNVSAETVAVKGNAVYVVDALTGQLIWSAGGGAGHSLSRSPEASSANPLPMYNSIPGDPTPVDIDGDGDMDLMYVIDIAGRIFRFDFDQTHADTGSGYASGGLIADLYEPSVNRRFYNGVDASLNATRTEGAFISLSVGSGYRAHPKEYETWANRFFVLIDVNTSGPEIDDNNTADDTDDDEITYRYVKTYDDDGNVTARNVIRTPNLFGFTGTAYVRGTNGDHGFYRTLNLADGEKVLQSSFTFNGDIFVSTYTPRNTTGIATCGGGEVGSGRFYRFNVMNGVSSLTQDYEDLKRPGIPPDPTLLLIGSDDASDPDEEGTVVLCIGTECDTVPFDTGNAVKTYWRED